MLNRRKVGTTSSHHGLYAQGYKRATMVGTEGSELVSVSKSLKADPSPDRGLQPAPVKLESLVIADQPCRGECVPEPCTHRPSSHPRRAHPKSLTQPFGEGGAEGEFCEGD